MAKEHLIDWDKYTIYENGEVFSRYKNDYLKNTLDDEDYVFNGYVLKDGTYQHCRRNRVVWAYFNGEIPDGLQIDHINSIKNDNRIENLRCVTPKENSNNPLRIEKLKGRIISEETRRKIGQKHKGKVMSEESRRKMSEFAKQDIRRQKPIIQYTKDGEFIREWKSMAEASRELNIPKPNIIDCCKGKRNSAGGYKWKYK